jgi:hypothetical protein
VTIKAQSALLVKQTLAQFRIAGGNTGVGFVDDGFDDDEGFASWRYELAECRQFGRFNGVLKKQLKIEMRN